MESVFDKVRSELKKGMDLPKCRKCGCMRTTLVNLSISLPSLNEDGAKELLNDVNNWVKELEPMEYPCFKCKYCIPPEAMNLLTSRYPSLTTLTLSTICGFDVKSTWPPAVGEYIVIDRSASVAVSTLASDELPEKLAGLNPEGLCIAGKTETENIGIDKIIKNIVTNPSIKFLIVAGRETEGHKSGETLLALGEKGVDSEMRVMGSTGRRPILKNVSLLDVENFRGQVKIENMLGCEDTGALISRIKKLSQKASSLGISKPKGKKFTIGKVEPKPVTTQTVPKIKAESPDSVKLDTTGYFVVIPSKKDGIITVEHYSYENKLLRIIEGSNSRDIYLTIINNKWVIDLMHAAYIGKELAKAELSIKQGFKYIQDGA